MSNDPDTESNRETKTADSAVPGGERRLRGKPWILIVLPLAGLVVGLGIAGIVVWQKAPAYVSKATLWSTAKLRLPERFQGTVSMGQLITSEEMRRLALVELESNPGYLVPAGPDGEPLPVKLSFTESPESSVCHLQAEATDPGYAQFYLEALLRAYLGHLQAQKEGALSPLTEQVQRMERDVKNEQDKLLAFQRSNNPPLLQAQSAAAADSLRHLTVRLAELELESSTAQPGTTAAESLQTQISSAKKLIQTCESKLMEIQDKIRTEDELKGNVERSQSGYDRLAVMVNNVGISRNVQSGPEILQNATMPERIYKPERHVFTIAAVIGFAAGVGIALFVGGYPPVRRVPPGAEPSIHDT